MIILSIDKLVVANTTIPQIRIEHWKPFAPQHASSSPLRIAQKVWGADWTHASPLSYYIQTADIFGPMAIPGNYGGATQVNFNAFELAGWRQSIIDQWQA